MMAAQSRTAIIFLCNEQFVPIGCVTPDDAITPRAAQCDFIVLLLNKLLTDDYAPAAMFTSEFPASDLHAITSF